MSIQEGISHANEIQGVINTSEIEHLKQLFESERQLRLEQYQLNAQLRAELEILKYHSQEKEEEANNLRHDVKILNQKLINEMEKRTEIQHTNDLMYTDLEQLTRQLFEEANGMVETEASRRYELEKAKRRLELQLEEVNMRLATESEQLKELKGKFEDVMESIPSSGQGTTDTEDTDTSALSEDELRLSSHKMNHHLYEEESHVNNAVTKQEFIRGTQAVDDFMTIDQPQYREFDKFVQQCHASVLQHAKPVQLFSVPFIKRCLSEDIEPCLQSYMLGGRSSYQKLIQSIFENRCMVEEIVDLNEMNSNQLLPLETTLSSMQSPTILDEGSIHELRTSSPKLSKSDHESQEPSSHPREDPKMAKSPYSKVSNEGHKCQMCGMELTCQFRYRLSNTDPWHFIDTYCRDRLVAVCEFYTFVKMLQQKLLVNRNVADLYYESAYLRRQIFYARIGFLNFFAVMDGDIQRSEKSGQPTSQPGSPNSLITRNKPYRDSILPVVRRLFVPRLSMKVSHVRSSSLTDTL
jgi:hypothetical protein